MAADPPDLALLLRPLRERPRGRRAAEDCDELAAPHGLPLRPSMISYFVVGNPSFCITGKLATHGRNGGTSHSCHSGHPRRRSRAAPAAPEDALSMDAPDFAVAQPWLRI